MTDGRTEALTISSSLKRGNKERKKNNTTSEMKTNGTPYNCKTDLVCKTCMFINN